MGKSLIITEKPSVARDIVEALGDFTSHDDGAYWESDQYVCTFAVGHVLELLEPEEIDVAYKRWTLATLPIIPEEFKLKPKSGQNDRIRTIKKIMQRADVEELINACDAGREGELIFRELVKFIGSDKPVKRLWLQSMTKQAIRNGFSALEEGKKFEGLASAAECRSLADWLIGMNASRVLTIRLRSRANKGAWSAGRVQTPTLALLVERELEILGHVPRSYWKVSARFGVHGGTYAANWFDPDFKADESRPHAKADRIFDEEAARRIVAEVTGKEGLASETRRPSRESTKPLFDLTSLQRESNQRFGWSAARTLQAAQRCYEAHKVLTYPRTDSRCLPNDYRPEVEKILGTLAAGSPYQQSARYLQQQGRQNDEKIFNDAGVSDHFAIIPTGQSGDHLEGDDRRIYDFVVRRFLAAFYPPAVWEQVERETVVGAHRFSSRARTLKEPGWRAVFEQEVADAAAEGLPPLAAGNDKARDVPVRTEEVATEADVTRPPPPISEGRLLTLMENAGKQIEDEDLAAALHEKGLGTPATRADIIENLKAKGYVDRGLRPTVKGMRLIDLLRRIHADRITSAELTGELELHLRQVEHGERAPESFMSEIIEYTKAIVESAKTFDYSDIYPNTESLGVCPCDKKRPVFERAWFYRCEEHQDEIDAENDCPFRIWKDKSGRYIDRATVRTLLDKGTTGELDSFRDIRGRTYKGILSLEGTDLVLKPIAGSEAQQEGEVAPVEFEVNPEPLGPCPLHKDADCQVVETSTLFICQERQKQIDAGEKKPVGCVLPRLVCKRELTRADALTYVQTGETPLIEDFISRFGRPFKAKLKMDPKTGKHKFEFPPREGGGGRKKFTKKKAGKGTAESGAETEETKSPKKKAPKKATKKKPAAKKKQPSTSEG